MGRPSTTVYTSGDNACKVPAMIIRIAMLSILADVILAFNAQGNGGVMPFGGAGHSTLRTSTTTTISRSYRSFASTARPLAQEKLFYHRNLIRDSNAKGPPFNDQTEGFYYIFAALVIVFLALCLWLFHVRRRKRRLLEAQAAGRGALELDIDGMPYPNNRRWAGRNGAANDTTREEGLDEHGEAPPPYKPAGQEGDPNGAGPASPLQGLDRGGTQPKPPDYQERTAATQDNNAQDSSTSSPTYEGTTNADPR